MAPAAGFVQIALDGDTDDGSVSDHREHIMTMTTTTTTTTTGRTADTTSTDTSTNTTTGKTARGGRIALLLAALVAAVSSLAVGTSGGEVEAWAWDPHVAVTGRATCSPRLGDKVTWMWFEASNGERGWAQLLDSASLTRRYRIDLYKVGTGGTTLTVKWGCGTEARASFGVKRPSTGIYTTRNLCPQWWTGPCWI